MMGFKLPKVYDKVVDLYHIYFCFFVEEGDEEEGHRNPSFPTLLLKISLNGIKTGGDLHGDSLLISVSSLTTNLFSRSSSPLA